VFLCSVERRFSVPAVFVSAVERSLGQAGPQAPAQRRTAVCVLGMSSVLGVKVPCAT
jgi:hypothetical protein